MQGANSMRSDNNKFKKFIKRRVNQRFNVSETHITVL